MEDSKVKKGSERKKGIMKELRSETSSFLDSSSIHGLSHVNSSKKVMGKLFWIVICIVCLSYAVMFITTSFLEWQDNAVSKNVDVIQTTVGAKFPAITICPTGYVQGGALEKIFNFVEVTKEIREKIKKPVGDFLRNNYYLEQTALRKYLCNYRCYLNNPRDLRENCYIHYKESCEGKFGAKKKLCRYANMAFLMTWSDKDRSGNRTSWLAKYPTVVSRFSNMTKFVKATNYTIDNYWVKTNIWNGNMNYTLETFGIYDIPEAMEEVIPEIETEFSAENWKILIKEFLKRLYGMSPNPMEDLGTTMQFFLNDDWYYYYECINDQRPTLDLEPFSDMLREFAGNVLDPHDWSQLTLSNFEEALSLFMNLDNQTNMEPVVELLVQQLTKSDNMHTLLSLMSHTLMPAHIYEAEPLAKQLSETGLFKSSNPLYKQKIDLNQTYNNDQLPQKTHLNRNSLVPICRWADSFLGENQGFGFGLCNSFKPSFTDRGICYTFNMDETLKPRLKDSDYKKVFEATFGAIKNEPWEINNEKLNHRIGVGSKNGFSFVFNSNDLEKRLTKSRVAGYAKLLGNSEAITRFPVAIHEQGTSALIRPSPESIDLMVYNVYGDPKQASKWNNDIFQIFHIAVTPVVTDVHEGLRTLNVDQRQCYFSDEGQLQLFQDYTREHCVIECKIAYSTEKCGCTPWDYPMKDGTKICSPERARCFEEKMIFASENSTVVLACNCLQGCINTQYQFSLTNIESIDIKFANDYYLLHNQTKYNFDWYTGQLADYIMDNEYKMHDKFVFTYLFGPDTYGGRSATQNEFFNPYTKRNLADMSAVNIYFETLNSLKIEKTLKVTFADKLGTIGGTLGLFLGMSIFSFVELANFLLKNVKTLLKYGRHRLEKNMC